MLLSELESGREQSRQAGAWKSDSAHRPHVPAEGELGALPHLLGSMRRMRSSWSAPARAGLVLDTGYDCYSVQVIRITHSRTTDDHMARK
jgi:hypothetical protein